MAMVVLHYTVQQSKSVYMYHCKCRQLFRQFIVVLNLNVVVYLCVSRFVSKKVKRLTVDCMYMLLTSVVCGIAHLNKHILSVAQ